MASHDELATAARLYTLSVVSAGPRSRGQGPSTRDATTACSNSDATRAAGGGAARGGDRRSRLRQALLQHAKNTWAARSASDERIVAPYSKAQHKIIEFMLPKLQLGADSVFFDLGCGDGRWLVPAAQRYGCRCVGLEVQHDAAEDARAAATAGGVQHLVSVREEDFFEVDYSGCTAAAVFLSKEGAAKLATLLRRVLRPGTPVVCLGFHLPGWVVEADYRAQMGFPTYLYRAGGANA